MSYNQHHTDEQKDNVQSTSSNARSWEMMEVAKKIDAPAIAVTVLLIFSDEMRMKQMTKTSLMPKIT